MWRSLFVLPLLLAGCAQILGEQEKGPQADLQYVSQARSLVAEWALVNDQAAAGRVTGTYARAMRGQIREQLGTAASAVTVSSAPYAAVMRSALRQPDDAAPARLRGLAAALKQSEDLLESA